MNRAGLLARLRFLRHLRARQVFSRCALNLKRRTLQALARRCMARLHAPAAALAADAPGPLLSAVSSCEVQGPGRYRFTFLNHPREFSVPFDWHRDELNRGNRLWKLNLHYMEYLGALPDAVFVELVDDWIRGNPVYHPGYWIDSWNSYTVSIRVVTWMQELSARRGRLPSDFVARCEASLGVQLAYLRANLEMDIGGNHLIKNLRALIWAGRAIDGTVAARLAVKAAAELPAQLDEQILADGFHYERSPAYHCQVFVDLLDCYRALPAGAPRDALATRLAAMAQVIADTTHPDGATSLFNDGGLHYTHSPRACLARYEELTGCRCTPRAAFAFPAAGYFGVRDGNLYLLADAGDVAPDFLVAHGHADTLAFELTLGTQRFIVDAGVYEYGAGEMRMYGRGTRAHNTVTLDGADSSEVFGEFRVGRRARACIEHLAQSDTTLELRATHDGYAHLPGAPCVRRVLRYASGVLDVEDSIEGGNGQLIETRLLFHPDVRLDIVPGRGLVARAGETRLELETAMPVEIVTASYSPDMGFKFPTRQVVMRAGHAPASATYRLRVASQ